MCKVFLEGRLAEGEAEGMLEFYFYSKDSIAKMIAAFKLWGRFEREGVTRLAGALKRYLTVMPLQRRWTRPFGTGWSYMTSVVKALGDIGDPKALDTLTRLYQFKAMLYKSAMEELKVEIFRSLSNYPAAAVKPLLERGLTSRNREVKAMSEKLLNQKGSKT